jgi:maleate isomerase
MTSASGLARHFDELLQRLLDGTGASRATLRIDLSAHGFHVDDVAGEAHKAGIKSLRGETSIDQRAVPTVQWLAREKRMLVQGDLSKTDVPAPPALISVYGVYAQMLAPILQNGNLQGWVSLHECSGPREWTPADIEKLDRAVTEVNSLLAKTSSKEG